MLRKTFTMAKNKAKISITKYVKAQFFFLFHFYYVVKEIFLQKLETLYYLVEAENSALSKHLILHSCKLFPLKM